MLIAELKTSYKCSPCKTSVCVAGLVQKWIVKSSQVKNLFGNTPKVNTEC